jgi:hypothetical protein
MIAERRKSERDEQELSRLKANEVWSDVDRDSGDEHDAAYTDTSANASPGAEATIPDSSPRLHDRVLQQQQHQQQQQQKKPVQPPIPPPDAQIPDESPDEGFSWTTPSFGLGAGLGALQATSAGLSAASSWAAKAAPEIEIESGFRALGFATGGTGVAL